MRCSAFNQFQEILIHSWDLAKGIGKDSTLDADLVEAACARALENQERYRASGVFGSVEVAVADDADTQTKLLAILGRKV